MCCVPNWEEPNWGGTFLEGSNWKEPNWETHMRIRIGKDPNSESYRRIRIGRNLPRTFRVVSWSGPRHDRILESPGTRTHAREARPLGGWRLSVSGEATPPRLQGGARLRPASPCGRERDGVSERGVRPQRSGGRALQVPCRAPDILAIRPLGWRLLPPYTRRHRTLDGERNRRGGPNMRP